MFRSVARVLVLPNNPDLVKRSLLLPLLILAMVAGVEEPGAVLFTGSDVWSSEILLSLLLSPPRA